METDDLAKVGLETRPDSESRLTALDAALFLDMTSVVKKCVSGVGFCMS